VYVELAISQRLLQQVNGRTVERLKKKLQELLIVSFGMECIFTKLGIYSDIHCMPVWPLYIN